MRILVLGAWCSCNLGDAVICQCVADRLQKRWPQAEVVIRDMVDRDRLKPRKIPTIDALERRWFYENARRWASSLGIDRVLLSEETRVSKQADNIDRICRENWDAVVFAGGQLFMDGYALFLERFVMAFAEKRVPVFFNACGTGPANSRQIGKRLKAVLNTENVRYVSCRDDCGAVDKKYLTPGAAVPTFDPALWSAEVFGIRKQDSQVVGLGVMYPWGVVPAVALRFWRRLVRELENRNIPWKMFTNGDRADIAFAQEILKAFPDCDPDTHIIPADIRPEELVGTISGFKSMISFRLHSHIIAASLGIPSVAVVWDKKLPLFFEKLGHKERCLPVTAGASRVLETLAKAEGEGVPAELIRRQAEQSMELLLGAMENALGEECL